MRRRSIPSLLTFFKNPLKKHSADCSAGAWFSVILMRRKVIQLSPQPFGVCRQPLFRAFARGKFALKYFRTDGSGSKVPKWPSTEIAAKRTRPRTHRPKERGMNRYLDESSRQTAKMNRERLASLERPAIMEEEVKKATAIRQNMARLRELRLAKEAQTVQTEVPADNQPAKAKSKKRFG